MVEEQQPLTSVFDILILTLKMEEAMRRIRESFLGVKSNSRATPQQKACEETGALSHSHKKQQTANNLRELTSGFFCRASR